MSPRFLVYHEVIYSAPGIRNLLEICECERTNNALAEDLECARPRDEKPTASQSWGERSRNVTFDEILCPEDLKDSYLSSGTGRKICLGY